MPSKNKQGGLGRGIDRLLPNDVVMPGDRRTEPSPETGKPLMVPTSEITLNPDQPRKYFNTVELESLSDSIRDKGVIEPIIVRRKEGGGYELIAGQRRLIATTKAGLESVPVIIRDMDDVAMERLELALIENIHRLDLNPIELAEAYRRLTTEMDKTDEQVGKIVGKDRSSIANTRRLLELPEEIKDDIRLDRIKAGHGMAILQIADRDKWAEARKTIIKENLSVRKAEALARKLNRGDRKEKEGEEGDIKNSAFYEDLEKRFTESLNGLKVKIYYSGKVKKIEILYSNNEEMEGLMAKLGVTAD
ncbi:MAG: ParB/RepB/Spo0J family partition protein [Deltaproteobacteria bacterium]|jgi:ParB family chromosome partitioning protein|nr:ParB/RepB/Spo0J family partition protein [Deltaproteobacteria bacterium]